MGQMVQRDEWDSIAPRTTWYGCQRPEQPRVKLGFLSSLRDAFAVFRPALLLRSGDTLTRGGAQDTLYCSSLWPAAAGEDAGLPFNLA